MSATARNRARRAACVAAGICIDCGEPASGISRCAPCNQYLRDRAKDRREARRAAGACVLCAKPASALLCVGCYEKQGRIQRSWTARNPGYMSAYNAARPKKRDAGVQS